MYYGQLVAPVEGAYNEQINLSGYVFDAYLRYGIESKLTITSHPVETGSPITDHAYVEPKTFTFDILMTDTAEDRVSGQFGTSDRSVNAYKLLNSWQENREIITLNCKYGYFNNILVGSITTDDDYKTAYALKATVVLRQLIITSTQLVKVSAGPWMTDNVTLGAQNAPEADEDQTDLVKLGFSGSRGK